MDFEEFARRFRERAATRMLEFEVALEQSRRDMERSQGSQAKGQAGSETQRWGERVPVTGERPRATLAPAGQRTSRGPVQGVLKRN
ncbi:hypothetical protein H7347_05320 [Corynebacterium sp. zg-331]|uniref:hypothetical protein n=1 Tax=unclassified Corynebacterium TaxID=2624378 RepID=UPI00128C3A50|nr:MULTISPECIES: hypothetical protein [unclassified Corynebacterium]MBC3185997.1 hypothetical protein [Corynebacterium sp. zg-331]MPV52488.1 hypothetical protein [Corynebacterium sp. zg331]